MASCLLPYHGCHALHRLVLLVHAELGQVIGHGPLVVELRSQPRTSQTLGPLARIWSTVRAPRVPHHTHLREKVPGKV